MTEILVFTEKADLFPELLGKARELREGLGAEAVSAAVIGEGAGVAQALAANGADKVYVAGGGGGTLDAKSKASALAFIAQEAGANLILLASTRRGRELAGRLAQKLGSACVTDVNVLDAEDGKPVYERYNLGGNTVERASLPGPTSVVTSMPKSFEPAAEGSMSGEVIEVTAAIEAPSFQVLETRSKEGESVNIEDAKVLIGVGKGFEKEAVQLALDLAKALGGEVGCTREPATDFGWFSEERIIGLSGKKAGPDVYIGVGISGQIQHTVGVLGARCIVVINKNKDAPFFSMADYGVVADLNDFLPKFLDELKKG